MGVTVQLLPLPIWFTAKVWPAMVSEPLRGLVLVLAVTLKLVMPLPLPLLPELIVIQFEAVEACQMHLFPAVTFTLPVPSLDPKDCSLGVIV